MLQCIILYVLFLVSKFNEPDKLYYNTIIKITFCTIIVWIKYIFIFSKFMWLFLNKLLFIDNKLYKYIYIRQSTGFVIYSNRIIHVLFHTKVKYFELNVIYVFYFRYLMSIKNITVSAETSRLRLER